MSTGRSIHSDSSPSRRRLCVVAVAALLACLCMASTSEAKPQIAIQFYAPASGGTASFYLYWIGSGNGTTNGSNYIWTYLYDVNGNVLSGYPIEDPSNYVIPASQNTTTLPGTAPTGAEGDSATGAVTVMLNDSGDWNGASTGMEPADFAAYSFARRNMIRTVGLNSPVLDTTIPVITPPLTSVSTNANTAFTFSGNNAISVNDPNGAASPEQLTLTVNHGTLTGVNQVAGLQVAGNGTPANPLVLTATSTTILNNALPALVYTPTPATYTGPDDLILLDTDTGNGLVAQAVTVPITVNLAGVPTITAPLRLNTIVNTAINPVSPAVTVQDTGVTSGTVTVSVTNGILNGPATGGGLTVVGTGSGTVVLTAATNNLLNGGLALLQYTPNTGYSGVDTLTILDKDNNGVSQAMSVPIPVKWITGPASVSTTVNGPISFKNINVATPSAGDTHTLTMTAVNGTLSLTQISGTAAQINATLGLLVYTPAYGYSGSDTLTLTDTDVTAASIKTTVQISIAVIQTVTNPNPDGQRPERATLKVEVQGKTLSHGETTKYDVWIKVQNPNATDAQKVRFVYALFGKTDAQNGHIFPIKQLDLERNQRMFNVVTHGSARVDTKNTDASRSSFFDYRIPKNSTGANAFMVKDLQVDLGKGVAPGDSVFMDIWVIDQANHEHYYLDRVQLQ